MCKLFFPSYAARTAGMQSRTAGTGLQAKNTTAPGRRGIGEVRQTRAAVLYQDREIA